MFHMLLNLEIGKADALTAQYSSIHIPIPSILAILVVARDIGSFYHVEHSCRVYDSSSVDLSQAAWLHCTYVGANNTHVQTQLVSFVELPDLAFPEDFVRVGEIEIQGGAPFVEPGVPALCRQTEPAS